MCRGGEGLQVLRTPSLFGKVVGVGGGASHSWKLCVCVCGLRMHGGGAGVWRGGSC